MTVAQVRPLSEGKHVKLTLRSGEFYIDAVGFNMGELNEVLKNDDLIDIAFNLDINLYRGMRQLQVFAKRREIKRNYRLGDELLIDARGPRL